MRFRRHLYRNRNSKCPGYWAICVSTELGRLTFLPAKPTNKLICLAKAFVNSHNVGKQEGMDGRLDVIIQYVPKCFFPLCIERAFQH